MQNVKRIENGVNSGIIGTSFEPVLNKRMMKEKDYFNTLFKRKKYPVYNQMLPATPEPKSNPQPQPQPKPEPKPQPKPFPNAYRPPWIPQKRDEKHKPYGEMLNVAGVVAGEAGVSATNKRSIHGATQLKVPRR